MDKNLPQFKQIIVVRMENRSFDNMCRRLTLGGTAESLFADSVVTRQDAIDLFSSESSTSK